MQKLLSYIMLLCAATLLTGFSWGFGSDDPCKNALELAGTLEGIHDEAQARQTEAKILSLCPDGGAGHYVSGLQLERVGNLEPDRRPLLAGEKPSAHARQEPPVSHLLAVFKAFQAGSDGRLCCAVRARRFVCR